MKRVVYTSHFTIGNPGFSGGFVMFRLQQNQNGHCVVSVSAWALGLRHTLSSVDVQWVRFVILTALHHHSSIREDKFVLQQQVPVYWVQNCVDLAELEW